MHRMNPIFIVVAALLLLTTENAGASCAPPPPEVTTRPSSVQFGLVNMEAVARYKLLVLVDTTASEVTIGQISGGNIFAEMEIVPNSDLCSGKTYTQNTSCSIEVAFQPTSARGSGQRDAYLDIPYSTPSSAGHHSTVNVGGFAVNTTGADISVQPSEVNFDLLPLNGTALQPFIISNVGTADLVVSSMTLTGPLSGLFSVATCTTIAPAGSCQVDIHFTQQISGPITAGLEIVSNDPDEPVLSIPLSVYRTLSVLEGSGECKDTKSVGPSCFIATAAYGSRLDPHVQVLRDFRDRHLMANSVGRAFVNWYYSVSPPIAKAITQHWGLRVITRFFLTGLIAIIEYPAIFAFGILGLTGMAVLSKLRGVTISGKVGRSSRAK